VVVCQPKAEHGGLQQRTAIDNIFINSTQTSERLLLRYFLILRILQHTIIVFSQNLRSPEDQMDTAISADDVTDLTNIQPIGCVLERPLHLTLCKEAQITIIGMG